MLLSKKYRCIFIHINKSAGTSIEMVLRSSPAIFRKHYMTAMDIRDFVCEDKWNEYFKFAIVRNPWDKMVSLYKYRRKMKKIPRALEFNQFIHGVDNYTTPRKSKRNIIQTSNQLEFCVDKNGVIILDYIGRFENIHKEWRHICNEIKCTKSLPHVKVTKSKHIHYSKYYDDESVDIISCRFDKDISYFGYKFKDRR